MVYYKEIEGYTLTKINYLGTDYFISYDADYNVIIKNASNSVISLPDSISISYTRPEGTVYGTFRFDICADNNTFQTNNIKFYSSPMTMKVLYHFNKQTASSPALINGTAVADDFIAEQTVFSAAGLEKILIAGHCDRGC